MLTQREPALPWAHRLPQPAHHRAPGQGRHPLRLLQPHRAERRRVVEPTPAGGPRRLLLLVGLQQLRLCTALDAHRGGEAAPARRVGGWHLGRSAAPQARAAGSLRPRGLRRPAAWRALLSWRDLLSPSAPGRGPPGRRLAPPPPLPPPVVRRHRRRGVSRPGTPAGCDALPVLGDPFGFLGVGGGIGCSGLLGHRARGDAQPAARCHVVAPLRLRHGHAAPDTLPLPAARRLWPGPARFVAHAGHRRLLRAPTLAGLPHPPGARAERDEPSRLRQAPPARALTLRLAVGPQAAPPIAPQRHALLKRYGGRWAVMGMALAHAQAEGQAIPAPPRLRSPCWRSSGPSLLGPYAGHGGTGPAPWGGSSLYAPSRGSVVVSGGSPGDARVDTSTAVSALAPHSRCRCATHSPARRCPRRSSGSDGRVRPGRRTGSSPRSSRRAPA